jgi:hypothetical protein
MLKLGHFEKIRNASEVLNCGGGEGRKRSVGPTTPIIKYYIGSRKEVTSYL